MFLVILRDNIIEQRACGQKGMTFHTNILCYQFLIPWTKPHWSVFPPIEFNGFHWIQCRSCVATTLSKIEIVLGRQYCHVRKLLGSWKTSGHHNGTILQGVVKFCSRQLRWIFEFLQLSNKRFFVTNQNFTSVGVTWDIGCAMSTW